MAKMWLDAEGIDSVIANENLPSMYVYPAAALGYVEVQVREEDAERAIEVLKAHETEPAGVDLPPCPVCGSEEVEEVASRWPLLFALFGFLPIPALKKKLRCRRCGKTRPYV